MEAHEKQLLIALFVIAAMVLAAVLGWRWLDRPREFSSLLPFSIPEITSCSAYLDYETMESSSIQLSREQTQELLDMLSQPTYHWVGSASGISVEEVPLIRIYLYKSGSEYSELMLNGEDMLVNPLTYKGDSTLYRMEGDSLAQHESLITFLEDCLTQNET